MSEPRKSAYKILIRRQGLKISYFQMFYHKSLTGKLPLKFQTCWTCKKNLPCLLSPPFNRIMQSDTGPNKKTERLVTLRQ